MIHVFFANGKGLVERGVSVALCACTRTFVSVNFDRTFTLVQMTDGTITATKIQVEDIGCVECQMKLLWLIANCAAPSPRARAGSTFIPSTEALLKMLDAFEAAARGELEVP